MELFTIDELRDIKESIEKPAMKKLMEMSQSNKYSKEFGMVGVRCGRQISNDIITYLKDKGYIK